MYLVLRRVLRIIGFDIVTVKTTVFNDFSKTQVAEFTRKFALYKRQFSPRWRVWKM